MPDDDWLTPGDPVIVDRIHIVWGIGSVLAGSRSIPSGLRKFNSFDALLDDRERFENERIGRIRKRRRPTKD